VNADFLMEAMWLVVAEVIADTEGSSGSRIGFMNITTWAGSRGAASSKIEKYLNSFGWNLVLVEKAEVIDEESEFGDEVAGMVERTRSNPNAIILGTFHTYKTN
jgi:hypothetical protein